MVLQSGGREGANILTGTFLIVTRTEHPFRSDLTSDRMPMQWTRRSLASWLLSFPVLVTGLLALVCLYLARTTWDLRWPYDVDLFRDIGQAQAVRDGNVFGDANYRG